MKRKDDKMLVQLTAGELMDMLKAAFPILAMEKEALPAPAADRTLDQKKKEDGPTFTGRLVYGVVGIERLFNVSHKTAQDWKDGWMRPAVKQRGRKIVVDVAYAMKLFEKTGKAKTEGRKR